ncbi:MAG: hypothetical protein MUF33_11045 [Candidatus Nanopelagicales bacterium]|jgi:hypothetical protein|nr:hypothetical protein [Candidatus Nanopelagicales bacterium]
MRTPLVVLAAAAFVGGLAAPATAADMVPVKLKLKNCDGCSVSATWSKGGKVTSKYKSATKKVSGNKALTFNVPKGYYMYFTATSKKAAVDAASVLVTQFVGTQPGDSVSPTKAKTLNEGAYYCLTAKKQTITARASLVSQGGAALLALWANPQLKGTGTTIQDGIMGMYGTQNTLICKGKYY